MDENSASGFSNFYSSAQISFAKQSFIDTILKSTSDIRSKTQT